MTTQRGVSEHLQGSWGRWALQGAGAIVVLTLFAVVLPQTASAGDDFERGFKRELGAIAAHEVVGIGRNIVGGVIAGPYGYRHSGYYGGHHRRHRYARPYRHHYRSHRGHGGSYRPHYRRHHRSRVVVHEHHHYYGDACYD